jgi:hypothetical protein
VSDVTQGAPALPAPSQTCVVTACGSHKVVEVVGVLQVDGRPVVKHLRLCRSHEVAYGLWLTGPGRGLPLLRAAVDFVRQHGGTATQIERGGGGS